MTRRLLTAALLAAATLATYANALRNGFVWDDEMIVVHGENDPTWANVRRILTSSDVVVRSEPTPYFRPLSRLTYVADRALFDRSPRGAHLVNVLLHAAAVLLTWRLGRVLLGAETPAALAALLLAAHPLNAEPVNFVTARNTLLAAALVLATTLLYARGRDTGKRAWDIAAAAVFLAGLLVKETALMAIAFLVAVEIAPGPGWRARLRSRAAPLAAMAAAACLYVALRALVLGGGVGEPIAVADVLDGARNAVHAIPYYLWLVLFPASLTALHSEPARYFATAAALLAGWATIAAITVAAVVQRRSGTLLGISWFAIHFFPVSTIIPFPSAPIAERYLYLPAIGLWFAAADQAWALAGRARLRRAVAAVSLGVVFALAIRTTRRNLDWRDNLSLFGSAVETEPQNALARYNLGLALLDAGNARAAREEWTNAVALDERHVGALTQLATLDAEEGRLADAERLFARVLELEPGDPVAHFNLGLIAERTGRPAAAIDHYRRFLDAAPTDDPALVARVRERVRVIVSGAIPPR